MPPVIFYGYVIIADTRSRMPALGYIAAFRCHARVDD